MLILPLHRPLNRNTFPFVTAILVVINVLVFSLVQHGDFARLQALEVWYDESGLAQQQWPAYLDYLEHEKAHSARADVAEVEPDDQASFLFWQRLMDARVDTAIRASVPDAKADPIGSEAAQTLHLEQDFDQRLSHVTTWRYLLRNTEIDPVRMVTHAFLHSGVMHLVGNLVFLIALGLLVEGPLGEWRFAVLYLAGIFGSAAFSLAWGWGESGGGLGASGAIASLMGAFCVIWGRRPVRFFWWFFVAFGYVKKPAIWLLPAWIGWEAFNLIFNAEAGIGFDAHLGGLITGALVGWLLLHTGRLREAFFAEASDDTADDAFELDQVRQALGRMDLNTAEANLAAVLVRQPENFEALLLHYRAARLGNHPDETRIRAQTLLLSKASTRQQVRLQFDLLEEYASIGQSLPSGSWQLTLYRRWMALGQYDEVEALLTRWLADGASASQWFALALARRDAGEIEAFHATLEQICSRFAQAPEAGKARFLLNQGAELGSS